MTILMTERLALRPLLPADAEAYAAMRFHPEVAKWLPAPSGEPRAAAVAAIERFARSWQERRYAPWGVFLEGRLIGHGGLNHVPEFGETEVLWALHPEFWGRGYATEVARAALDHGFGTLGLELIFAIKPARGSGGKGITVIAGRDGEHFVKPSGVVITVDQIRHHVSNILGGVYSLGGKPDVAFVEALVQGEPVLSKYTFEGLPDIRVIVFRGFPVMAMMRCPTHASDGKANLHQGAVGVGLDICSGRALRAVQRNHPIERHPDTGVSFADLVIPGWRSLLELAASCYEMNKLGYQGCDIVLDRNLGPLILELNARPGLAIQIANGLGLRHRLMAIEAQTHGDLDVAERVARVYQLFGGGAVDAVHTASPL